MMKEFLGFLRWGWVNFETWQRAFILAAFLQGVGWTLGGQWGPWIALAGAMIILGFLLKWCVWDAIKSSWAKYKQHRNELLTTIKTSDERKTSV